MHRVRPAEPRSDSRVVTLPLFSPAEDDAPGYIQRRAAPAATTADLALQTYWAAAVQAHALAAAARQAVYPHEREALGRLASAASQCQELAGELLEDVWHIRLPRHRDAPRAA